MDCTEIWWPPLLNDCKGNNLDFDLDAKILEAPSPLKKWREWVSENNEREFIAVESSWDLSEWESPWVEDGLIPERLSCEYRFDLQNWETCGIFENEIISVPKTATKFEMKFSWMEIYGLNRVLVVEHLIPQYQIRDYPPLSINYISGNENKISLVGDDTENIPLVLFSINRDRAFFESVNESWDLKNLSISCEGEEFWIMGIDSLGVRDFNIGKNAEIFNGDGLIISGLLIGLNDGGSEHMKSTVYWDGLLDNEAGVFLWLENSKDDHEVAVELKSFDMLQLYGSCEENSQRTTNSMLQGVFLMWILLTVIMVVSGILAWKKQQDLNRNSFDEES